MEQYTTSVYFARKMVRVYKRVERIWEFSYQWMMGWVKLWSAATCQGRHHNTTGLVEKRKKKSRIIVETFDFGSKFILNPS